MFCSCPHLLRDPRLRDHDPRLRDCDLKLSDRDPRLRDRDLQHEGDICSSTSHRVNMTPDVYTYIVNASCDKAFHQTDIRC